MPRKALRTRSKRKVYVRTPGGRVVIHYEPRPKNPPSCAWCGAVLHGIPSSELNKYSKSEKTVERPYGGYLCHNCLEKAISNAVFREWGL